MKFTYSWKKGTFLERINRFIAMVEIDKNTHKVHVPNTGRLKELLISGASCHLSYHPGTSRKTEFDLRIVEYGKKLVSIDSQLPNVLVEEALNEGLFDFKQQISCLKREQTYKNSRFDFSFHLGKKKAFMEVKGVTLANNGWGYFPDAPTIRGRRHIEEMIDASQNGFWTALVFIIQNNYAKGFSPNTVMDPAFSKTLEEAVGQGVRIYALQTQTTLTECRVTDFCPVILKGRLYEPRKS